MNPKPHTRVINGEPFDFVKTHRDRKGNILWYCYKSKDGRSAYQIDLPSAEPTPVQHQRGFMYSQPMLKLAAIVMFFIRR